MTQPSDQVVPHPKKKSRSFFRTRTSQPLRFLSRNNKNNEGESEEDTESKPVQENQQGNLASVVEGDEFEDEVPPVAKPSLRPNRVRSRRVRNSFRPLSVIRRSVLFPFDFDTDAVMQRYMNDQSLKTVVNQGKKGRKGPKMRPKSEWRPKPQTADENAASSSSAADNATGDLGHLPFANTSEISLATALKTTSPEKDLEKKLEANYSDLRALPAPDISQHPAFSPSSPSFSASASASAITPTNNGPLQISSTTTTTTTTTDDVRSFQKQKEPKGKAAKAKEKEARKSESSARTKRLQVDTARNRTIFGIEIKTPTSARTPRAGHSSDSIPVPPPPPPPAFSQPQVYPQNFFMSDSSVSTIKSPAAGPSNRSRVNTIASDGLRKFSDMFKSRTSLEKSESSATLASPVETVSAMEARKREAEAFLRRTTNTPAQNWAPGDHFPQHPGTSRGWAHRNLRCTNCIDECCAVCKRACCAYKAAVLALDNNPVGTPAYEGAQEKVQQITAIYPYGREAPTFLKCTGEPGVIEPGCGKLVCPDCCSVCPDVACGDTQCRRCKPGMWENCEWHADL